MNIELNRMDVFLIKTCIMTECNRLKTQNEKLSSDHSMESLNTYVQNQGLIQNYESLLDKLSSKDS